MCSRGYCFDCSSPLFDCDLATEGGAFATDGSPQLMEGGTDFVPIIPEMDILVPDPGPVSILRGSTSPAGGTFVFPGDTTYSSLPPSPPLGTTMSSPFATSAAGGTISLSPVGTYSPSSPPLNGTFAMNGTVSLPHISPGTWESPSLSPEYTRFQYPSDLSTLSSPGRFVGFPRTGTTPVNFVLQPPPLGRRARALTADSASLSMAGFSPDSLPVFTSTPVGVSPQPMFVLQSPPPGRRTRALTTSASPLGGTFSPAGTVSIPHASPAGTWESPSLSPEYTRFQFPSDISTMSSPGRFVGFPRTGTTPVNFVLQTPPLEYTRFQYPSDLSTLSSPGRFVGFPRTGTTPVNFVLQPPPLGTVSIPHSSPAGTWESPSLSPEYTRFQYPSDLSTLSSPGRFVGFPRTGTTPVNFVLQTPPAEYTRFQYPSDLSTLSSPGRFVGFAPTGTTPVDFVLQPPPPVSIPAWNPPISLSTTEYMWDLPDLANISLFNLGPPTFPSSPQFLRRVKLAGQTSILSTAGPQRSPVVYVPS
ncbi:uncharacterized protein [Tiliqua scincoides]|uniref:uncharacterized protein n=1 Tax=Tiliqua scincoides TaxID=71010 RepID=UPI003462C0E9